MSVLSTKSGLQTIQPLPPLYENSSLASENRFMLAEPEPPFRVLVADFCPTQQWLIKTQIIGKFLHTLCPYSLQTSQQPMFLGF